MLTNLDELMQKIGFCSFFSVKDITNGTHLYKGSALN